MAGIDVNQPGFDSVQHEPQRGGSRVHGKWHDALLVAAMADIGEKAVVNLRVAVAALKGAETLDVSLIRAELQSAEPCVDANNLCRQTFARNHVRHGHGRRPFPGSNFNDQGRSHLFDQFGKSR